MNKFKKSNLIKINIKKEKFIFSYLVIITSIFGIFFYTFIIVDVFSFLASILYLILGVSLTILHLKGKLCFIKKRKDNSIYLISSILSCLVGMLNFLIFIINPYRNATYLIISLVWLEIGVYNTLCYVKLREIQEFM